MKSFVISQFNYCPINRIHERALRIAYNDYTSDFNHLLEKDDSVRGGIHTHFATRNVIVTLVGVWVVCHDVVCVAI